MRENYQIVCAKSLRIVIHDDSRMGVRCAIRENARRGEGDKKQLKAIESHTFTPFSREFLDVIFKIIR